jgi:hypothetical protein
MKTSLLASLAFGATLALAGGFATDARAAKAPKPKAEPAKPVGEPIEYDALETRVGETVSIDTTFRTTRTGKLIKWTRPALTVEMGTADNPMVLTVPKETIKSITIMTPPPAAEPAKDAGTSGAKKN